MSDMEWRTVVGWPDYEVSSTGLVRRTRRARRQGQPAALKTAWMHKIGYPAVSLQENGRRKNAFVHRIVCEAFHGPAPSPAHEVAHRDGSRTNNDYRNLRWATRAENCADTVGHGTRLRGERQNGAKLTAANVREIRRRAAAGEYQSSIAADFGVQQQNVSRIVRRDTWAHVFDGFDVDLATLDLEALRPFLTDDAMQKALNAFVRAGGRECRGAQIYENTSAVVR